VPRAPARHHAARGRPGGSSWQPRAGGILAAGFLPAGTVLLRRLHVLVFIEHGTRRMHPGGVTEHPAGEWTVQQARNLAMSPGERFADIRFLIATTDRTSHPRPAPSSRPPAPGSCAPRSRRHV